MSSGRPLHVDKRRVAMQQPVLRRRQRLTIGLLGISFLLVISIFIAGYVVVFVMPHRELVVKVDGVEHTRGDLVELVRIRQKSSEFLGGTFDASSGIFESLQLIVENEILMQMGPSQGIFVSDEDINDHIVLIKRLYLEFIMRPEKQMALGKSEEQIARETSERHLNYLNTIQIDESTHRSLVRKAILREKFRQQVGESVPFVAEQVHLFRIVMPQTGEMDIMQVKYEDAVRDITDPNQFQLAYIKIAREFSVDIPEKVRLGGDMGWIAKGVIPDYQRDFFLLDPGELSEPVKNKDNLTQTLFFMISERQPAKELSSGVRNELKSKALQDWVNDERSNHDVYAIFNSDIYDWIFQQLRLSSRAPTPTPDPLQAILNSR
ncbi:MAG TPA: peptidylprolyl isomerase [Dehalococcoidia bacterium]|nr:peptidylprolyl isomerase [Dehalococcoidia bacterium]